MKDTVYRLFKFDVVLVAMVSACVLFIFDASLEAVVGATHRPLSLVAGLTLAGGFLAVSLFFSFLLSFIDVVAECAHGVLFQKTSSKVWTAALFALFAGVPFFITGSVLGSGDWISLQPWAFGVAPLVTLFGVGVFFATGYMRGADRTRNRAVYTLACGAFALTALILDAFVYPGIYPSFHHLAFGLFAVFSLLLSEPVAERIRKILPDRGRVAFRGVALVALAVGIFYFSTPSQDVRSELLTKRRVASYLMSLAPKAGDKSHLRTVLLRIREKRPVSFEQKTFPASPVVAPKNWNVILLIVDAMRADTLPPNRRPKQVHAGIKDTPFLDRWIADSVQFKFAYSPSNMTDRSMPSIFSGLYPTSLREKPGIELPRRMSLLGRTPLAVVNQVFHSKRKERLAALTKNFKETTYYSDTDQMTAVPAMLDAAAGHSRNPFFAWFHFYCLHNPYFAETGIQKDKDGPFKRRYRRALKWFDTAMKELWTGIEQQGLQNNTIVVLTADHGEGLGDRHLETHGSYIFDEETHVPLYVRMPGNKGGIVSSTVGLVDLTATLTDLLGRPASDTDGVSFAPLVFNPTASWNRDYYLENASNNYVGVVHGRDKLVYFKDGDTFYRFDLKKDPREKKNGFRLSGETDQLLLARLVFYRPDIFLSELDNENTRQLFDDLFRHRDLQTKDAAALLRRIASVSKKK
jgi:hypothetical protein